MTPARVTGLVVLAATAAALVTGCGGDDDRSEDARPPERLSQAVTRLAEAGTGHFASRTAGSDGVVRSTMEGDYRLSPPATRLRISRTDPGAAPRATEVVAIAREVWSRDAGTDQGTSCWVRYDVTELFTSGLLVRNGDTYVPAPVAAAAFGAGVYATDDDQVTGTSRLSTVLAVADLSLPALLTLALTPDQQVPITFTLDRDDLVGWKVFVRDVVEQSRAVATSTSTGDSRLNDLASGGGSITTELSGLGDDVPIAPPPAGEVVDYVADAELLAERVAACGGQAP